MSDRNIDELMDELYHLVDKAWRLPMSGGTYRSRWRRGSYNSG